MKARGPLLPLSWEVWPMRKGNAAFAVLAVTALVALAFFLPEWLSTLHDR